MSGPSKRDAHYPYGAPRVSLLLLPGAPLLFIGAATLPPPIRMEPTALQETMARVLVQACRVVDFRATLLPGRTYSGYWRRGYLIWLLRQWGFKGARIGRRAWACRVAYCTLTQE